MLGSIRTKEAFVSIVWTILMHFHRDQKQAKLKRILDLFDVS